MASALLTAALPSYDTFKSSLEGEVVLPGEEGYDFGIARWTPTVVLPAQYVVFPKTNEDVSKAIKFARAINVEIAVCGGGHSWSGTSSTRGLVVHLGKYMNSVRCDTDAKLFYVGGGALWKDVDDEGYKHGLAAVAGAVQHTGVGGLALGGGFGWLSGRHGLVVDNTIQYTVVLASGEIVKASEKENPDLFWGMRGGGSNFGIATEFVFKAHPQRPTVFLTRLVFPVERIKEVIETVEAWYETACDDEMALVGCMRMPPTFDLILMIMYHYNGEPEQGRAAFKTIYDLGPLAEISSDRLPYDEINAQQNDGSRPGFRTYSKGLSLMKITPEIATTAVELLAKTVEAEPKFQNSVALFEFVPKRVISSVPVSAMAYSNRAKNREVLLAIIQADPELDEKQREEVRGWHTKLRSLATDVVGTGYANYEGDASKGAEVQFGENYARLQTIKAKYDPDKVFNKWFPIEPAAN